MSSSYAAAEKHFLDLAGPSTHCQPLSSSSKLKHLHRLVRKKVESRDYLVDLYRQRTSHGGEPFPATDDLAQVYDVRTTRFAMELPRAKGAHSKYYGSQPALGQRHTQKTGPPLEKSVSLGSLHSSSLPVGLNLAGLQGFKHQDKSPRSKTQRLPSINQFKFEDNLLTTDYNGNVRRESEQDSVLTDMDSDFNSSFQRDLRRAEEEVKHNWLLDSEIQIRMKKFSKRKSQLSIRVPDEDPMVAISRRLEEIHMMAKPRRDKRYVLDRIDSGQKDRILVSSHTHEQGSWTCSFCL